MGKHGNTWSMAVAISLLALTSLPVLTAAQVPAVPRGTSLDMDMKLVDYLMQHGMIKGLFTAWAVWALKTVWQNTPTWSKRLNDLAGVLVEQLADGVRIRNDQFVQRISNDVASVYTQLYKLLKFHPVRVMVMKFQKMSSNNTEHLECYLVYEAPFLRSSQKESWQGIWVSRQMRENVALLLNEEEQYIYDVEQMEPGDYRDMLMGDNTKSVVNMMLLDVKNYSWVLSVHFDRTEGAEVETMATIRLVAANIRKTLQFKNYWRSPI